MDDEDNNGYDRRYDNDDTTDDDDDDDTTFPVGWPYAGNQQPEHGSTLLGLQRGH
jgi:hypothetical protein